MNQLAAWLATAGDLALVVLGFGFIIFVHELGHFLAAKWAGIRVLAFAIGFGPALGSYRKGMGLRLGSGEAAYKKLSSTEQARVSPTEYRLNVLPLGGYVKMLGQEDLNPNAVSKEQDSYQNTPAWKRMVVISAGVVMNIILAGVLFVIVFMQGLKTEPPKIGGVLPGSRASQAIPIDGPVTEPGLKAGDLVLSVNGRRAEEFTDLVLASAMARRGDPVRLVVERPGVDGPLTFDVVPKESATSKLLEMGIEPFRSTTLADMEGASAEQRERYATLLAEMGLEGVRPGSRLISVNGVAATSAEDLVRAAEESAGRPVAVVFEDEEGRIERKLRPRPELQSDQLAGTDLPQEHLLGLVPVMTVSGLQEKPVQGLRAGDVFARLGNVEYPSFSSGRAEILRRKGSRIEAEVLRGSAAPGTPRITIEPPPFVQPSGTVGFPADSTADRSTILGLPPAALVAPGSDAKTGPAPAAASVISRPGTRIRSIGGTEVGNFGEIREALRSATRDAAADRTGATVMLELLLPIEHQPSGSAPVEAVEWTLSADDVQTLHALGWASPISVAAFQPEEIILKASGPADAIRMGIARTHRVMLTTYLTFARLFQGTVKVEHLKGPVGIAHMGTRLAERGFIWLLFFMALISVNLAVINFLPLPIVDGGQFLFLVFESIRGRPVSIQFQNIATIAGLLLIGTVFVVVTFNDIANLF